MTTVRGPDRRGHDKKIRVRRQGAHDRFRQNRENGIISSEIIGEKGVPVVVQEES
jgi:hypothetical protein